MLKMKGMHLPSSCKKLRNIWLSDVECATLICVNCQTERGNTHARGESHATRRPFRTSEGRSVTGTAAVSALPTLLLLQIICLPRERENGERQREGKRSGTDCNGVSISSLTAIPNDELRQTFSSHNCAPD